VSALLARKGALGGAQRVRGHHDGQLQLNFFLKTLRVYDELKQKLQITFFPLGMSFHNFSIVAFLFT